MISLWHESEPALRNTSEKGVLGAALQTLPAPRPPRPPKQMQDTRGLEGYVLDLQRRYRCTVVRDVEDMGFFMWQFRGGSMGVVV